MAHVKGEKRAIMKLSKPGRVGCGDAAGFDAVISEPPHTTHILDKTWKAIFAVGKSSVSFAKCSMVEITFSKMAWFAVAVSTLLKS